LKFFALLAGVAFVSDVLAQEIVTVSARPGVTQSFFIANMGEVKPEAVALLLSGGGGNIRLRTEGGQIKFGDRNFLPRSRREFIRNGVLPVILDNPSDQQSGEGMSDEFRESLSHVMDIRAVMAEVRKRYPGMPIFLVGTSRSTLSVAYLAGKFEGEAAGAVLSSSLFYTGSGPRARQALARFNWGTIRIPLLVVHHAEDGCGATPYMEAQRLASRFPLITVRGGKAPESAPCEPLAAHGFYGKEAETVDAMAAWMLKKPFAKDIR
jgi:hypothetical protein